MADDRRHSEEILDPGTARDEISQGNFTQDPGVGYETTDASISPLVWTMVAIFATVILVYAVLYGMYNLWRDRENAEDRAPLPIAKGVEQVPPEPRLQPRPEEPLSDPTADLLMWRAKERTITGQYQWIDQPGGVVKIPIDRAMDIVAERGLPTGEGWEMRPGEKMVGGVLMPAEAMGMDATPSTGLTEPGAGAAPGVTGRRAGVNFGPPNP